MSKDTSKSVKFKNAIKAFVILAALLIVFTVLSWGVASSWGAVRISRTEFVGNGGATQSGWMFTPKGVNDENPAPAIVDFHGRNTTAYNLLPWAIEQSRRGYVVFLPDQEMTNESLGTEDNTTARIAVSAIEYIYNQDFVTEVSAAGHSMGNIALKALMENEDIQKCLTNIVSVGNMFMMNNSIPTYTNFLSIEAQKDFYAVQWVPNVEAKQAAANEIFGFDVEFGVLYGNPTTGSARKIILLPTSHQQQMYSEDVLTEMLSFIEMSSPSPNKISYDNQIFPWAVILLTICSLLLIAIVADFAYILAASPIFSESVITSLPKSEGKSRSAWLKQIAMDLLIPFALFIPVTNFIAKHNPTKLFKFGYVNQIFLWIFSVGLVGLVLILIRYFKARKVKKLSAVDYGMGDEGEAIFNGKRIFDGFIIAVITTTFMFMVLDIVCKVTGLNYQFLSVLGQLNRLTPERFVLSLPYAVLCTILLVVININIATTRRMKTTGNETTDTLRDIIVNICLSAGTLSIMLFIEFLGVRLSTNGESVLSMTYFGALAYGLSFPFMMSSSAGISTFLFRKTGNIWTGVFTSAFVLIFLTCNFGLITG